MKCSSVNSHWSSLPGLPPGWDWSACCASTLPCLFCASAAQSLSPGKHGSTVRLVCIPPPMCGARCGRLRSSLAPPKTTPGPAIPGPARRDETRRETLCDVNAGPSSSYPFPSLACPCPCPRRPVGYVPSLSSPRVYFNPWHRFGHTGSSSGRSSSNAIVAMPRPSPPRSPLASARQSH